MSEHVCVWERERISIVSWQVYFIILDGISFFQNAKILHFPVAQNLPHKLISWFSSAIYQPDCGFHYSIRWQLEEGWRIISFKWAHLTSSLCVVSRVQPKKKKACHGIFSSYDHLCSTVFIFGHVVDIIFRQ